MRVTYVGHSTFKLDSNTGISLIIDPWIKNNPVSYIDIDSLTDLTAVLDTHGGYDHVADAPYLAKKNWCPLLCDPATWTNLYNCNFPNELIEGCVTGIRRSYNDWEVKVLDAKHPSMYRDSSLIGPAISYLISIDEQNIYHMGDTSISAEHKMYAELYDPSVVLVPIGEGGDYFPELYPDEAALVVKWLDPQVAIPMHYPAGSDRRAIFNEKCEELKVNKNTKIVNLEPGDSFEFDR